MVQRRIPLTVYQPARAGVHSFALLASFEAASRSVIISVFPIELYRFFEDARIVSEIYLLAGLFSLTLALLTPLIARYVPRRWLYTGGATTMIAGSLSVILGGSDMAPFALVANAAALVVMTICFNAYVMDYIERTSLGRNESARLVYSGIAWAVGPLLGVSIMDRWPAGPFYLSILCAAALIAFFWYLRLGNGKVITRASRPAVNPFTYLPRFFRQPLLVAGWLFSAMRSIGWQTYIVYVPIFAVDNGLGDQMGGLTLSISNTFLFLAPLMLRYLVSRSVRFAIMTGFGVSGVLYLIAASLSGWPMATVVLMVAGTLFLVILDVSGGLPFLMSVKPSERTEMASVFSTYRDVSGVVTPAFARLVLVFSPVAGVFAVTSVGLLACAMIASRLHPRLGKKRLSA